jgi:hypothetical protein
MRIEEKSSREKWRCLLREARTQKQWHTQEFFSWGGSTNSVEDRGQGERGSGGGSPLVSSSTQFVKE